MRNMVMTFRSSTTCDGRLSPVILVDDAAGANSSSSLAANDWHRIEPGLNLGILVCCWSWEREI